MRDSGNTLFIVEDRKSVPPDVKPSHCLIIFEAFQEYDTEREQAIFERFITANFASATDLPLYEIIKGSLLNDGTRSRSNLSEAVMLSQLLVDRVNETNVERIQSINLDPFYRMVVLDVGKNTVVETDIESPRRSLQNIYTYLQNVFSILPFVADQLLSFLFRLFLNRPDKINTVFATETGRFNSVRPVIDEFDKNFEMVITPMIIAWLRSSSLRKKMEEYDPIIANCCMTITSIVNEYKFILFGMFQLIVSKRTLEAEIRRFIKKSYDIELYHSTWYIMNMNTGKRIIRSLCYFYVYDSVISKTDCDSLSINSASPTGLSILAAGAKHDISLYHITHSVVNKRQVPPPFNSTVFIPGEFGKEYVENLPYIEDSQNFEPLGRPYLAKFAKRHADTDSSQSARVGGILRITLATQTLRERVRLEFVETVLEAISAMDQLVEVIIKTHPGEDPSFYDAYPDRFEFATVKTGDLFEVLEKSDLLVTVNSNVGIESVIVGTPSVCVNLWEPTQINQAFAESGPIPILRTPQEVNELFVSFTQERLDSMIDKQQSVVESGYVLEGNPAKDIGEKIRNSS